MREVADASRVRKFMRALGEEVREEIRVFFTGGATAVLYGWRAATIDIDVKIVPETSRVFDAIPKLKETLQINVELASPADFIPELSGWEDRSRFIGREGTVSFYHYDLEAQALAKLERGHAQDLQDAREMVARGLVEPAALLRHLERVEPGLSRYPAIDPASFRRAVEAFVGATG